MAAAPIATFVLGPQTGGRGYRLLDRSEGAAIPAAAEGRLSELALVLAGWAERREPPAVLLVPIGDAPAPAILLRLAQLGSGSLGTIAFANGLLLDAAAFAACAGRPETLLDLIPVPDGSRAFAAAPVSLTRPTPPPPHSGLWDGLGLEWRDRLVTVPDQAAEEPTLRSILRSLPPTGPGTRVRGCATTASLPTAGGFAPGRDLQLIVLGPERARPASLDHLPAPVGPSGLLSAPFLPTQAVRAWQRLKDLGAQDSEVARAVAQLRWSQDDLDAAPADVIGAAAGRVLPMLAGGTRIHFLLSLASPRGDLFDRDFASVARHWLGALLEHDALAPEHGAYCIKALAEAPPHTLAMLGPLGPLLLRKDTGRWLGGRTFARMLDLGFAQALADRPDDAYRLLAGFDAAALSALAHRLLAASIAVPPALQSALARRLADAKPDGEGRDDVRTLLAHRLKSAAAADERLLGSRHVVNAVATAAPAMMTTFARRVLTLRDKSLSPREKLDMLGATLEWLRLEGSRA